MECEREERREVVTTALPDASTATAPRTVEPSLNVTVPVGVPAPEVDASTVAVNVTACPACDGLRLDASEVVVPTVVGVVEVDVGASWPCALVSSGAAAAGLFSRGRPDMSSTVRRTLLWVMLVGLVPGANRGESRLTGVVTVRAVPPVQRSSS